MCANGWFYPLYAQTHKAMFEKKNQFIPAQFYKITTEGKKNGLRKPARTSTFCLTYNMPTTLQSYS